MKIYKFNYKSFSISLPEKTDIVIVGGGTVGMTLGCLLKKYNLNYIIVEKEKNIMQIMNHPKAHYISPKTVEVFKTLNIFTPNFFSDDFFKKADNWRHYRYCEYLLKSDSYSGEIDHFDIKGQNSI